MILSAATGRGIPANRDSHLCRHCGGGRIPIELAVPGWRSFPPGVLQLDRARLTATAGDPHAYGRALGEMLFADGAVGDAFRESLAAIGARQEPLRMQLRIDPSELQELAWERLVAPVDGNWLPLAATAATPFSRYLIAQDWSRPAPVTERPLQLLAIIAAPANLADFGLDAISSEERQMLHDLLDSLPDVTVNYLESGSANPPTITALTAALTEGYHAVHFLCHGAATARGTALYLENDAGQVAITLADRLLNAFALSRQPPQLCFLAACESAAHGRHGAFVPLGPALVERCGLAAVVAMSDLVGLTTARRFTSQFYTRLLHHGLVDLAMNEARALVQDQWDWGVPVLFCRLQDSQLIDFPVGHAAAALGNVAVTMDRALEIARLQDHGEQLVAELERLMAAFEESFRHLVQWGNEFRAVGSDAATFAAQFDAFYLRFKTYYDEETFTDEQALLRQMIRLKAQTLPKLRPLLDDQSYQALQAELEQIAVNRAGLIQGFGDYLEPMNRAVDAIKLSLTQGDIAGAISSKLEFETQISPSLRRSKELLHQISTGISNVQAA
ncbi:MAG: CHAT domain-containing protein [Caldilineaceae bacterium]